MEKIPANRIVKETLRNIGGKVKYLYSHPSVVKNDFEHNFSINGAVCDFGVLDTLETIVIAGGVAVAHSIIAAPITLMRDTTPKEFAFWLGFAALPCITNLGSYLVETGKEIYKNAKSYVKEEKSIDNGQNSCYSGRLCGLDNFRNN